MTILEVFQDVKDKLKTLDVEVYPGRTHFFDIDGELKEPNLEKLFVIDFITGTPEFMWGRVDFTTSRFQVNAIAREKTEAFNLINSAVNVLEGYEPGLVREHGLLGRHNHLSQDFF